MPAPPHRERLDDDEIRDDDEEQFAGKPPVFSAAKHQGKSREPERKDRGIGKESEPLIEQEPGEAAGNERKGAGLVAVRG